MHRIEVTLVSTLHHKMYLAPHRKFLVTSTYMYFETALRVSQDRQNFQNTEFGEKYAPVQK